MIQWGLDNGSTIRVITLPTAFTICTAATYSTYRDKLTASGNTVYNLTPSSFKCLQDAAINYFAIGY